MAGFTEADLNPSFSANDFNVDARVATNKQPRGRKLPPIVAEYAKVITVRTPRDDEPHLTDKRTLLSPYHGLYLLVANFCGVLKWKGHVTMMIAIWFEFLAYTDPLQSSLKLQGAWCILLIHFVLSLTFFCKWFVVYLVGRLWTKWSSDWTNWKIGGFKQRIDLLTTKTFFKHWMRDVRAFYEENISFCLRLEKIACDLNGPDVSIHSEIREGFKLVGMQPPSGVFSADVKPRSLSEEDLVKHSSTCSLLSGERCRPVWRPTTRVTCGRWQCRNSQTSHGLRDPIRKTSLTCCCLNTNGCLWDVLLSGRETNGGRLTTSLRAESMQPFRTSRKSTWKLWTSLCGSLAALLSFVFLKRGLISSYSLVNVWQELLTKRGRVCQWNLCN